MSDESFFDWGRTSYVKRDEFAHDAPLLVKRYWVRLGKHVFEVEQSRAIEEAP